MLNKKDFDNKLLEIIKLNNLKIKKRKSIFKMLIYKIIQNAITTKSHIKIFKRKSYFTTYNCARTYNLKKLKK